MIDWVIAYIIAGVCLSIALLWGNTDRMKWWELVGLAILITMFWPVFVFFIFLV